MPRTRIRGRLPGTVAGSGSSGVPAGSALLQDSYGSLEIQQDENNLLPTETNLSALSVLMGESNTLPTESQTAEIINRESNNAPTDALLIALRYFATVSSDNDSGRTNPTNANGQPDAVLASVSTNKQLGDLTNPVILTSTSFGVPSALSGATVTAKRLRVWAKQTAGTLGDTSTISYNVGAGDVVLATRASDIGFDDTPLGATYDVSSLTLAQLGTLSLKASYNASVVAAPSTALLVDAWCVELDVTFP